MLNKEAQMIGFVRLAVEAHNATYHTDFSVVGQADDIYPRLKGSRNQCKNWDWVCRDSVSRKEAAIEIKRLTTELAEKTHNELTKVAEGIWTETRDRLRGVFSLFVDLPNPNFVLGNKAQRKRLVEVLAGFVTEVSNDLPDGETKTMRVEADDRLSDVLPADTWLNLFRHDRVKLKPADSQMNYLSVSFDWGWSAATQTLVDKELDEFKGLIAKANKQLGVAKQRGIPETFLVLVEIGFSGAAPDAVKNTLDDLDPATYSNINHIYLVGYPHAQRAGGIVNSLPASSAPL